MWAEAAAWILLGAVSGSPDQDAAPPAAVVASVEAAVELVLSRGRRDGSEHLMLIDSTGGVLVESAGTGTSAGDAAIERRLGQPGGDVWLVHNHPRSTAPSASDVANLAKPACRRLVVIGHDGSRYMLARGALFDPSRVRQQAGSGLLAALSALHEVAARGALGSHIVNVALHRLGIIEYAFTLSQELTALSDRHHREVEGAIRQVMRRIGRVHS